MGEVKVPVLHGIDLDIYRGELTVVLGASGSGKSTLLNMVGGIDRPTEGTIMFGGSDIALMKDRALTEYRRKSVGFVFQFYNLVPTLTAEENVQVSTEVADSPMDPKEALKLVELDDRADHFPSQLSGGQQQRVAIARALAKNPSLMLCDEPTGALDFKTGQLVLKTLAALNEKLGTTIVIITHCAPIAQLAHRVIRLGSGVIQSADYNDDRKKVEEVVW
jgi:putative ABC transport system ATP-binding protein